MDTAEAVAIAVLLVSVFSVPRCEHTYHVPCSVSPGVNTPLPPPDSVNVFTVVSCSSANLLTLLLVPFHHRQPPSRTLPVTSVYVSLTEPVKHDMIPKNVVCCKDV